MGIQIHFELTIPEYCEVRCRDYPYMNIAILLRCECSKCVDIFYFHVQNPYYIGLSRMDLKGKAVVLFDDEGHALCDGLVCNTNPLDCVDNRILGAEDVGVIILNPTDNIISLDCENIPHRWPLSLTKFEGHTLAGILLVHHNATREVQSHRRLLEKRQYNTARMCAPRPPGKKIGKPLRSMCGCYQQWIVVPRIVARYSQGLW